MNSTFAALGMSIEKGSHENHNTKVQGIHYSLLWMCPSSSEMPNNMMVIIEAEQLKLEWDIPDD